MGKPNLPSFRNSTKKHKLRIEKYISLIQNVYDKTAEQAARLALLTGANPDKQFFFSDYPTIREAVNKLQQEFFNDILGTVYTGTTVEWKECNQVQDLVADKVIKAYTGQKRSEGEYPSYFQTNTEALKAFQNRKVSGLNLSQRVWNLEEQNKTELEMAISAALEEGMSAARLSVEIKRYLNDPDLMFRRFRYKDTEGNWQRKWKRKIIDADGKIRFIDCDKKGFSNEWTGPGYYKSSSKNAKRIARTEINMAYRTAEQKRWEQFDFVVGYEVHTTQNGHHIEDICDQLAGKYPKSFHFTGWHPQCMCYCIPILKTEEEFWNYDHENPEKSVNEVTDVPAGFKEWVNENNKRIESAEKSDKLPYFLSNNKEYWKEQESHRERRKTAKEIADERHALSDDSLLSAHKSERLKAIKEKYNQWAKNNLEKVILPDKTPALRSTTFNKEGNKITINQETFNEIFYKNKNRNNLNEVLQIATEFDNWFPTATHIRTESGIHHKFNFNVYEVFYKGHKIEVKTKLTDNEYLYNIRFIK